MTDYFRLARVFLGLSVPLARAASGEKANFNGSFAHFGSLVLALLLWIRFIAFGLGFIHAL